MYGEELDAYFVIGSDDVTCKSTLDTSSGALEFFNGCLKDTTDINFLGAMGLQILEWFNVSNKISLVFFFWFLFSIQQDLYLQYTTSFLFFLPFVAFHEKRELETQAKYVHSLI